MSTTTFEAEIKYVLTDVEAVKGKLEKHALEPSLRALVLRDAGGSDGRLLEDVLLSGVSMQTTEQLGCLAGRLARSSAEVAEIRGVDESRARIDCVRHQLLNGLSLRLQ
jgi:hypothetical protein